MAWWVLPNAVRLLTEFTPTGATNIIDAQTYLGFVMRIMLAFGIAFLLPVIMVALNFAGIGTAATWRKGWRWAVLLSFVFAAVVTPTPDAITMLAVAIPMSALYFLALGVCVAARPPRRPPAGGRGPAAAGRHDGRRARRRGRPRVIHLGLVINPTAGKGRGTQAGRRVHELAARARAQGRGPLGAPRSRRRPTGRARRRSQGLDALVVVGGDGMVHLGVNVVAGTGLPLGIVAAGTGNDIARTLGLPRGDAEASVAAVEHGLLDGPRRVDAVRVGSPVHAAHEWYLGVLSCGFDAAINARANEMTWPKGSGRYVRALAAELGRFRPYGYRVTLDDSVWESAGTLVAVANVPWIGGGLKIAPDARRSTTGCSTSSSPGRSPSRGS